MKRRLMFTAGLMLLVAALVGAEALSQRLDVTAHQSATLTLRQPAQPDPMAVPVEFHLNGYYETSKEIGGEVALCVILSAVLAVIITLMHARRWVSPDGERRDPGAPVRLRLVFVLGLAMLDGMCLVGGLGAAGFLLEWQHELGVPSRAWPVPEDLTGVAVQTRIAQAAIAAGSPLDTPTPGSGLGRPPDATAALMQTAVMATAQAGPAAPQPGPDGAATYRVDMQWPRRLEATRSGVVIITFRRLTPDSGNLAQPPLADRYLTYLSPAFKRDDFDVTWYTNTRDEHTLNLPRTSWAWNVTPTSGPGQWILAPVITSVWKPLSVQRPVVRRVLMQPSLAVTVTGPAVPTFQLTLLTLIAGVSGALLCTPWLNSALKPRPLR